MLLHSPKATALVARFEGCRLSAYQDGNGIWTIGYGHTSGVKAGDTCDEQQALLLLSEDLNTAAVGVTHAITRYATQNQFDAMVSLCFNIGCHAFLNSTVAREFNAGDTEKAADAFLMWDRIAGNVSKGLSARRQAERELFLS